MRKKGGKREQGAVTKKLYGFAFAAMMSKCRHAFQSGGILIGALFLVSCSSQAQTARATASPAQTPNPVQCFAPAGSTILRYPPGDRSLGTLCAIEWQVQGDTAKRTDHIVGVVVNQGPREYASVRISFRLYDASGSVVGDASDSVSRLKPGETWRFSAFTWGTAFAVAKLDSIDAR
jgi:hypothetical protein